LAETDDFIPALNEKDLQDGSMKLQTIEGIPVLLIKQQSKIYAIDNRCPHMGCSFASGTLDGKVIICPCHDWRFNLETGEYEDEPLIKLKMFEWKVKAGKIWVKLDE
jgi:nitrite reductase/ring-hydroxylating ferredoxin subunit